MSPFEPLRLILQSVRQVVFGTPLGHAFFKVIPGKPFGDQFLEFHPLTLWRYTWLVPFDVVIPRSRHQSGLTFFIK